MSFTIRPSLDSLDTIPPVIAQALAAGWVPGPPDHLTDDTLDVDKFTAAVLECERCNATGGRYRAVHRLATHYRYRAFSVCRECGHPTEF